MTTYVWPWNQQAGEQSSADTPLRLVRTGADRPLVQAPKTADPLGNAVNRLNVDLRILAMLLFQPMADRPDAAEYRQQELRLTVDRLTSTAASVSRLLAQRGTLPP